MDQRQPLLKLNLAGLAPDAGHPDAAAVWATFSKCSHLVENGRRYENLAWRLWNRQASQLSVNSPHKHDQLRDSVPSVSALPDLSGSTDSLASLCPPAFAPPTHDSFLLSLKTGLESISRPETDLFQPHSVHLPGPTTAVPIAVSPFCRPAVKDQAQASLPTSTTGSATVTPSPIAGLSPGRSSSSVRSPSRPVVVPQSVFNTAFTNTGSSIDSNTSTSAATSTTLPTDVSVVSVESPKSGISTVVAPTPVTVVSLQSGDRNSHLATATLPSTTPASFGDTKSLASQASQSKHSASFTSSHSNRPGSNESTHVIKGFKPPPMSLFKNHTSPNRSSGSDRSQARAGSRSSVSELPSVPEEGPSRPLITRRQNRTTLTDKSNRSRPPPAKVQKEPVRHSKLPIDMSFKGYLDADVFSSSDEEEEKEEAPAVVEDDGNDDWVDEDEEDAPDNSTSNKLVFERVDSRANLTSRRSLLTSMINGPQRNGQLANKAAASTSNFRRPADSAHDMLENRSKSSSNVSGMSRIVTDGIDALDLGRPMTPRTTRRNMVGNELPKDLREDLLRERTQIIPPVRRGYVRDYFSNNRDLAPEEDNTDDDDDSDSDDTGTGPQRRKRSSFRKKHYRSDFERIVW